MEDESYEVAQWLHDFNSFDPLSHLTSHLDPTSSSPGTVLTESMLCERLLLDSITGIDDPDVGGCNEVEGVDGGGLVAVADTDDGAVTEAAIEAVEVVVAATAAPATVSGEGGALSSALMLLAETELTGTVPLLLLTAAKRRAACCCCCCCCCCCWNAAVKAAGCCGEEEEEEEL